MSTSRSSLGEHPVPKPKNQGSSTSAHVQEPKVQKTNGDSNPLFVSQSRRDGVYSKGQGGSGNGQHKGDNLPR